MSKLLYLIQNLSLDVTAGAVISSLFICRCFGVEPTVEMMLGLAIAIWLIYTIDHLRDAAEAKEMAVNPRHLFHQQYKRPVLYAALIIFVTGIVNALRLPGKTILAGLILGALSGLYFVYLRLSKEHKLKEFFAAIIYTAGIFAAPASLIDHWEWGYLIVFVSFFLLVAANLVLFPLYEAEMDNRQGVMSIALKRGRAHAVKLVAMLLVLNLLCVLLVLPCIAPVSSTYIFVAMNLVLAILLIKMDWFQRHQLYRWLGDGIFFIPALALL